MIIYLIRHGERADANSKDYSKIDFDFDPPLSDLGIFQSEKTSFIMKKHQEIEKSNGFLLISSPFLRCVQTANVFLKNIPNIYENKIFIEENISEVLFPGYFEKNVLSDLIIRSNSDLRKYDINKDNIKFEEVNLIKPEFPEFFESFEIRFLNSLYELIKKYRKKSLENNLNLIIITHGLGINAICKKFDNDKKGNCGYCSITKIKILEDNSIKIEIKKNKSHLKELNKQKDSKL